jgi:thiol:disulfide interchange protein DsbD
VKARCRSWVATSLGLALLLLPALALAAQEGGSDTGAFQRALARGPVVALGACFVFGLATALTPCVYPMIVITVSVFGAKEAKSRLQGTLLSATFVLGIVCLFTPLGVIAALTHRGFSAYLGNLWVVSVISLVFLVLAASLFGAFELALPSSLQNRLSSVGGAGYGGAFVLGLVCSLVAAPCVGPFLLGLLGWISTTGNIAMGAAAMAAYGVGLGTLFFLVGAFAVNLPKAGAWMMGIKWIGGVALAYMAFAYVRDALPHATLRKLAHPDTWYGAVGAVLSLVGLGLGVVHVLAERRKSPIARLSKPAKLASIVPAVLGALVLVTWWQTPKSSMIAVAQATTATANGDAAGGPPELRWETSEAAAVARATTEHKPLLVDFGAEWCGACKELERETFPDARVRTEGARFVALQVDATNDDDAEVQRVLKKYGVDPGFLPIVVLLDSTGKEALRFVGFVAPDKMAASLRSVH